MTQTLIFETHSTSTDNEAGVASGWLDCDLSELGERQAGELGERRHDVACVYSSDLRRAAHTAEIAFGGRGIAIITDPRLRECNYGSLNGAPARDIEARRARHVEAPFPGGESYREAVSRVAAFLDDLRDTSGAAPVVVIGHTATKWALDHLLLGADLAAAVRTPFEWQEGWEYPVRPIRFA